MIPKRKKINKNKKVNPHTKSLCSGRNFAYLQNKYFGVGVKYFLTGIFILGLFGLAIKNIFAVDNSITNGLNQSNAARDAQKKIQELEKKAQVYRDLIDIKKKQQNTLNNQISIMEAEIAKSESEIDLKKEEIKNINDEIDRLEEQIAAQEESMARQKKIIADLLQVYYQNKQDDVLTSLLGARGIAFVISSEDKLTQTGDRLNEMIKNVKSLKDNLEQERQSLEDKKNKITDLYYELEQKNSSLENNKEQKEVLISQTKGEELKYKEMLAKVEAQKLELLSIDDLSIASGLSADAYAKPPAASFAPVSWYYSQKDPRWGNETIGRSNSTMKNWGCAVSAVAMVFTQKGGNITPKYLSDQSIFSWDLINWPKSWPSIGVILSSTYGNSHGNINWASVDAEIKKGNPVIVYIKKTNRGGGHYVVIHHKTTNGKYVVHDPYFGPNIYLDTSRALVGKMGVDSGTIIDQMIVYKKK